nr:inactive glycosyltransferase 25 family member 3 isoform X3 [Mirounga angustirostris]
MPVAPAAPLLQLLLLLEPWLQAASVVEPPLPAVVLTVLARNAEHSLPHYLGALERLDYPRARLALWQASFWFQREKVKPRDAWDSPEVTRCATDHNTDNTTQMLQEWLVAVGDHYAAVVWRPEGEPRSYPDEEGPKHWTRERHQFLMELKQEALTFARDWGADYILFADTDNILTNNQTLRLLIEQGLPVVAPMLDSQTYYSNFWCGITPQGYYRRTADYFPTKNRQRRGCFQVPMVHSTFLVSLRAKGAAQLAFYPPHPNYTWPFDDIIVFAYACQAAGVTVHVCNEHRYGYMNVPVKSHQGLEDERVNFIHLILEALVDGPPMWASAHVSRPPKRPSKLGFDEDTQRQYHEEPRRGPAPWLPGPLLGPHTDQGRGGLFPQPLLHLGGVSTERILCAGRSVAENTEGNKEEAPLALPGLRDQDRAQKSGRSKLAVEGRCTDCPGVWTGLHSWPGMGPGWASPPRGSEKSLPDRGKRWGKGSEADWICVFGGKKESLGLGPGASAQSWGGR